MDAMSLVMAPPTRKLGMVTKLAYGLGSVAYGIKDNGFLTFLLLFYNQVIGLRADLVGLAILAALVLDAFIDPLIGQLSDHTQSRWGRRHPFMYAAAVPVGVLYLLLWNPPAGSQALILAYLVVVAILVRTAISCYEVPSAALAPELTADYHERTSVLGYRYLFGWLGSMVMLVVTFKFLLVPTAKYPIGQLNPAGYHAYAVIASLIMTAAILISAVFTHREIRYLPRAAPAHTRLRDTFGGVMEALRNRAFRLLLISGIFGYTAQGLTFALTIYINTFYWAFPASIIGSVALTYLVGVGLAFAMASRLSQLMGKRPATVLVSVICPFVIAVPYILRGAGLMPANGHAGLIPILLFFTAAGTAFGVCANILGASMMSDVVEDAQMRTGERTEGLFFAGSFFMQKCVSGLGLYVSGAILTLVGFPTGAAPGAMGASVLNHLVLTYFAALFLCTLISAAIVHRFPLGGQREHDQRLAQLADAVSHAAPLPGSEAEMPVPLPS